MLTVKKFASDSFCYNPQSVDHSFDTYAANYDRGEWWKEKCLLAERAMTQVHRQLVKAQKENEELNKVIRETTRSRLRKFHHEAAIDRSKNVQSKQQQEWKKLENTGEFKRLMAENKNLKRSVVERGKKLREAQEKIYSMEGKMAELESNNKKVESDIAKLLKLKLARKDEEICNLKTQLLQVLEQQENEKIAKSTVRALQEEAAELRKLLKEKLHQVRNAEEKLYEQHKTLQNLELVHARKKTSLRNTIRDLDHDLMAQKHKNEHLERADEERNHAVNLWQRMHDFVKGCNDELESKMDLNRCDRERVIYGGGGEEERLQRNLQTVISRLCRGPLEKINTPQSSNNANLSSGSSKVYRSEVAVKQEILDDLEPVSPVSTF